VPGLSFIGPSGTCLDTIRALLAPGGLAILDLYDPKLEYCLPSARAPEQRSIVRHPTRDTTVNIELTAFRADPVWQLQESVWSFSELGPDGAVRVAVEREPADMSS
jgi:hypothetical protein